MSKKTRKKFPDKPHKSRSPAKTASEKPSKETPKTTQRVGLKISKPTSVKKSSPKTPAKPATATATATATAGKNAGVSRRATKAAVQSSGKVQTFPTITEGSAAPAFNLPRDGGTRASLRDFAGRKLVLFFYPRADTPGCTKEAMDFSRLAKEFTSSNAAVVGISADTLKAQESFQNKHQLTIPLISDESREMIAAYGAWGQKSMYGRSFLGILRTTVLIDPNGKIARIWRNVRVDGHAEDVLATVRSL
jgi:peroxiredoxin Q/BCP